MQAEQLDAVFAALADPTRRAILARLAAGEASVTELAAPFDMTLPAISKHLKVLERAGLVARGREAQWRPCRLEAEPLREAFGWLDHYRRFWDESLDRLDNYLQAIQKKKPPMPADTDRSADRLVITRTLDAPLSLVWKVHSQAEHLARWWGPKGLTWVHGALDFRPGGRFHYCMRGADGYELWGKFEYREIEEPSRIVWENSFSDSEGGTVRAPFMAEFPLRVLNILTFAEDDGRTLLRLEGAPLDATDAEWAVFKGMHPSMQHGFGGTFAQLDAYLAELQPGNH